MKGRIKIAVLVLVALYLLVFRFVLEPQSDANWVYYVLVDELRMFVFPLCLLGIILNVKNWKFILAWLLLAVMSIVVVGHPSWGSHTVAPAKTLKILTYNVAAFGLDKGEVLKVMKESGADIICLQEACKIGTVKAAGAALSKQMRGYYWTGASTNMILSRYPLSDQDSLNVPTKWPTKEFPSAVVSTPLGPIRVMCVHLEPSWVAAWPPAFNDTVSTLTKVCQDRRAQADLILARLRPSKEPVILAGDFNGPTGSETVSRFAEFFTDSFAATERGFGNTILSKMPYKRIDYVWVRDLKPMQSEVINSTGSDHRPVLTIIGK